MRTLAENQFGHGAKKTGSVRRKIRRSLRPKVGKSAVPFDWSKGFDIRDAVGPIKKKNQGQSFTCGRQAGSYGQYILRRLRGIDEGELSAKSGYGKYKAPGGGMTVSSVETCIAVAGTNLEKDVPSYDANGNPLSEDMMSERSYETPQTIQDAFKRAGYTPVDVKTDLDSVAEAVQRYGFVIMEIEGQNNGTWLSPRPAPPSLTSGEEIWAHYMCIVGAKDSGFGNEAVALQSWGEGVGDKGEQYFGKEYFDSGYILDTFAFEWDENLTPEPGNDGIYASLVRYFKSLPWFGKKT